jgi:DDE superfamily endonuclease
VADGCSIVTSNGKRHYLWRAVDQDDNVLDILVQSRRHQQAAKKFFRKLLKGLKYVPRVVITDKLKSYGAAKREILPGVEHRQSRYLNNRGENSHRPTRQRERRMQGFKSPRPCPALSGSVWPHLPTLPTATASAVRIRVPSRDQATIRELGRSDGHGAGRLRAQSGGIEAQMRPLLSDGEISLNNLTIPSPRGGFAQKSKNESKIAKFRALNL